MLSLSEMMLPLLAVVLVLCPLYFLVKNPGKNAKSKLLGQIGMFVGVFLLTFITQWNVSAETVMATSIDGTMAQGLGFVAAALSTGCSSIGAGIAVAAAAPAAIGAISENSDNFGKAMIFVALGEGVAIYGLLISILIMNKL